MKITIDTGALVSALIVEGLLGLEPPVPLDLLEQNLVAVRSGRLTFVRLVVGDSTIIEIVRSGDDTVFSVEGINPMTLSHLVDFWGHRQVKIIATKP